MEKKFIVLLVIISLFFNSYCQNTTELDYFDQTAPGIIPEKFAHGIISFDDRYEQCISFSKDGKECAVGISNEKWNIFNIEYMTFDGTNWSTAIKAPFVGNMDSAELVPTFAPDTGIVYFISFYPELKTKRGNNNIWKSEKIDGVWSEPVMIPDPVSSNLEEWEVTVAKNGVIYFSGFDRPIGYGNADIYRAEPDGEGNYKEAVNLGKYINTGYYDDCPAIAHDESYLVFTGDRPGGFGQWDMWVTYKKEDGSWTNPKNMGSTINTGDNEVYPYISPDGKYLFFTKRDRLGTAEYSDIYWVSITIIDSLKGTNYTPYLYKKPSADTIYVNQSFIYELPDSTFFDDDGINTLTYSASLNTGEDLPGWLEFNSSDLTFTGKPDSAKTIYIKITATDDKSASVSASFRFEIIGPNNIYENTGNKNNIKIILNNKNVLLQFKNENHSYYLAEIYSIHGKKLNSHKLCQNIENVLDISGLKSGVYVLNVISKNNVYSEKIIIN